MDGQTDEQMTWNQYTPFQLHWSGGIIRFHKILSVSLKMSANMASWHWNGLSVAISGGHFIFPISYQYRNSHYKNKTVPQLSYLYQGNPYNWKDGLDVEMTPDRLLHHGCSLGAFVIYHIPQKIHLKLKSQEIPFSKILFIVFRSFGRIWYIASGLILGLCPANERRCYKVTLSLIGWVQT